MTLSSVLLMVTGPLLVWALAHRRLRHVGVTGPILMVALGAAIGWSVTSESVVFFDSTIALYLAEVILALLLFVDAVDIRGPLRSHLSAVPIRLLAIALPLSLLLVVTVGLALPLELSVVAVLAITCLAVPVDFSPELSIVRDHRIPESVRRWLGIESGYNDGLVAPFLLASLALATTTGDPGDQAVAAFVKAAPSGAIAVAVGAAVGTLAGWVFRRARSAGWADPTSIRVGVLALPLFTFAISVVLNGNGFVAAFVCGVVFRIAFSPTSDHDTEAFSFVDDVSGLVNLILWLAFGVVSVALLVGSHRWWPAMVLAAFVLTVGRIAPVLLSLVGSDVPRRDRVFMAAMGPRGAASIVFGLIAFNALPDDEGFAVLVATCFIVLGSLALHGVGAPLIIRRLYGRGDSETRRANHSHAPR
ncbi:cation:proton antiporter domain-containing protein [Rhodococcoides corynebacterioides]|uniref:cation:proton antiporter domain-containing protein n=1 Tax=Rhodococcoides corynebacterioides TaxID=53972 RepID=UPI003F7D8EC0